MRNSMFRSAAALLLAGLLGGTGASANQQYGYDDDENYSYYDDGQDGSYDDAEVYYEDYYGADNAYDLYFHRSLGGYGEWINLPGAGYVWRPWTVRGWSPYSLGYWGWARGGWTWISYEPFGHITYHYGNWGYLDNQGWCWFPGYRWAPHHVQWSSWDSYVGWCPTPPRLYSNYGYRFHNTERHYVWVPNRNFLDRNVSRYARRPSDVWRNGRGPRNIPLLSSPSRSVAERWTGRIADQIQLEAVNRSTRRGNVQIWLPDRQTRERVQREGSVSVRPWLDLKRRHESQNSDERRREVKSGAPWRRQPQVRTDSPERTIPRERERQQADEKREERRSDSWRRQRRHSDGESGRVESRPQPRETRQSSRDEAKKGDSGSSSKERDQPSRGWRGKENDDQKDSKDSKSSDSSKKERKSSESGQKKGNRKVSTGTP